MGFTTRNKELLNLAFNEYLIRKEQGKAQAISFANSIENLNGIFKAWDSKDFINDLKELEDMGFVKCYLRGGFVLTDYAIEYLE